MEKRLRSSDEAARRALLTQIEDAVRDFGDVEVDVFVTITSRRS